MNKIALITGAGSGIGRASAIKLLQSGYQVVLTGRRLEPLQQTAELAGEFGQNTLILPADVSQPDQVKALFEACEEKYGRLDLLFNNAGRGAWSVPMEELAFKDWQAVVDVNLTGPFLCTQQAFRIMKQ
ncbi:MAG: SDR family NAD(P)-dependent oxidoreductase, partial [Chloroflexota bacterium]